MIFDDTTTLCQPLINHEVLYTGGFYLPLQTTEEVAVSIDVVGSWQAKPIGSVPAFNLFLPIILFDCSDYRSATSASSSMSPSLHFSVQGQVRPHTHSSLICSQFSKL